MAIDQKKLMGAFGLEPVQNLTPSNSFAAEEDEDDDPFLPGLPELDGTSTRLPPIVQNTEAPPPSPQDFNTDVDYIRRTQASLIGESQRLVQIAMENAESGSSKDIFAAADTIRAASETTERLLTVHEKIQAMQEKEGLGNGNTFVQNQVVFQGTTEDAMRMIREKMRNGQNG